MQSESSRAAWQTTQNETHPFLACVPRHGAICVSRYSFQIGSRQTKEIPESVGGDIRSSSKRTCSSRELVMGAGAWWRLSHPPRTLHWTPRAKCCSSVLTPDRVMRGTRIDCWPNQGGHGKPNATNCEHFSDVLYSVWSAAV